MRAKLNTADLGMSRKQAGTPKGKNRIPLEALHDHFLITPPSHFAPQKVRGWLMGLLGHEEGSMAQMLAGLQNLSRAFLNLHFSPGSGTRGSKTLGEPQHLGGDPEPLGVRRWCHCPHLAIIQGMKSISNFDFRLESSLLSRICQSMKYTAFEGSCRRRSRDIWP